MARPDKVNYVPWAFWCLALSVDLLPIGLGGDRPVPLGLAQAGMALSCLFLVIDDKIWNEVLFFNRLRLALGLLALVLVWALIQTQPVVPDSWKHPLWQEASAALKMPLHGSISVSPEDSLKGLARLLTYIAGGILAYILALDARRAMQFVRVFWYVGVAICAYGLITYMAGSPTILWFRKWAYEGDVTGTFVNHNHFAIYGGMVMTCGAALLFRTFLQDVAQQKPQQRLRALREWLIHEGFPQGLFLTVVLMSIVFSHSRAGLALSLAGVGSYFFFYQIYLRAWARAALIAFASIAALALGLLIAIQASDRFATLFSDYSSLDRWQIYKLGWRILLDNPWIGYGLNGFEPEFRLYQQNMLMEFNHAHNDILESLIDLGIPFGLLLWTSVGLLLSGLLHGVFHRRQNGMFPALALAASVMVLLHSCVDFSLQIPSVALSWTYLLGIGLAQSWRQSEKQAPAP